MWIWHKLGGDDFSRVSFATDYWSLGMSIIRLLKILASQSEEERKYGLTSSFFKGFKLIDCDLLDLLARLLVG